jgi:hypothetical protein
MLKIYNSQICTAVTALVLAAACDRPNIRLNDRDRHRPITKLSSPTLTISFRSMAGIDPIQAAPINGYHIAVIPDPECKSPTHAQEEIQVWSGTDPVISLDDASCGLAIRVEVGTLYKDSGTVVSYFANFSDNQEPTHISKEQLAANPSPAISIKFLITDAGWEAGYGEALLDNAAALPGDDYIPSDEADNNGSSPQPQPIPPPEDTHAELHVYKAELRKGTVHPTYWMHDSHKLEVKNFGSSATKQYDYADLWLAKQLTLAFDKLHDAPYGVRGVSHMGIYNYRNVAGTSTLSRHSFALAIDIAGFRLENGDEITVEEDWKGSAHSELLHNIRNLFCQYFDVVLSPDYNADHRNHLHLDLNPKNRAAGETSVPTWDDLADKPSTFLVEPQIALGLTGDETQGQVAGEFSLTSTGRTCR